MTSPALVEAVARKRFARWQEILWEDGAQTIEWDELSPSERALELDCAQAAIAAARPIIEAEAFEAAAEVADENAASVEESVADCGRDYFHEEERAEIATAKNIAADIRKLGERG